MEINTNHFGVIEYSNEDVIYFETGIPGFEDNKDYILVLSSDDELPFDVLQSIDDENVSFIVTNPFLFVDQYDFELSKSDLTALRIDEEEPKLAILSIVTIPEDAKQTTINIVAPIVINLDAKLGKQIMLDEYEAVKYPIFKSDEE